METKSHESRCWMQILCRNCYELKQSVIVRPSKKNMHKCIRIELAFVPYSFVFFFCHSIALFLLIHNSVTIEMVVFLSYTNYDVAVKYTCTALDHQAWVENHLKGFASILFLIVTVLLLLKLQTRFHSLFPPFSSFKFKSPIYSKPNAFGDLFYDMLCGASRFAL